MWTRWRHPKWPSNPPRNFMALRVLMTLGQRLHRDPDHDMEKVPTKLNRHDWRYTHVINVDVCALWCCRFKHFAKFACLVVESMGITSLSHATLASEPAKPKVVQFCKSVNKIRGRVFILRWIWLVTSKKAHRCKMVDRDWSAHYRKVTWAQRYLKSPASQLFKSWPHSSASLALRKAGVSLHKGLVMRKAFLCHGVFMKHAGPIKPPLSQPRTLIRERIMNDDNQMYPQWIRKNKEPVKTDLDTSNGNPCTEKKGFVLYI